MSFQARITAQKEVPTIDAYGQITKALAFCNVEDPEAFIWIVEGLPNVPYAQNPSYPSLYEAEKNLRLFRKVFIGGIGEGKYQIREVLGITKG
jgi:hypothetical protein